MKEVVNRPSKPESWLSYSCYAEMNRVEEQFVPDHVFSHILEGTLGFFLAGSNRLFHAGDMILVRRNQLAKCTKYPAEGGQFKSTSIRLSQQALSAFSQETGKYVRHPYEGDPIVLLRQDAFYKSFIDSLSPYSSSAGRQIDESLKQLKTKEAILHILRLNNGVGDLLFDFGEPGKIDLEEFMIRSFTFNVEMKQFAYLTGRSLATFKRDFEKIFHTSPGRWLHQKRLAQAYYLIREKGKKPSDVYLEVGFEDLSHFSFAFKKEFGKAPSLVGTGT
jgi:AraC family transcriptional regulator, exoenzyme S synthesis regulatory protein ExsA